MAKSDKNLAILQTVIGYLKRHLMLPPGRRTGYYYTAAGFAVIYCSTLGFTSLAHAVKVKIDRQSVDIYEDLSIVADNVVGLYLCIVFALQTSQVESLIKEVAEYDDRKPVGLEILDKRIGYLATTLYYGSFFTIVAYGIFPTIYEVRCIDHYIALNITEICGLVTPVWLPFNIDFTPAKQFYVIFQLTAALGCLPAGFMVAVLAFGIYEHVSFRIRHFRQQIQYISECSNSNAVETNLKSFVQHHRKMASLIDKTNHIFSTMMCVHIFITSTIITLVIHQIFKLTWRSPAGPLLHVAFWITALFMNCYGAQGIINESSLIGDDIYCNLKWYELKVQYQKVILIIITRARQPLRITTGAFGYMSYSVFLTVMKAAYTLLLYVFLGIK